MTQPIIDIFNQYPACPFCQCKLLFQNIIYINLDDYGVLLVEVSNNKITRQNYVHKTSEYSGHTIYNSSRILFDRYTIICQKCQKFSFTIKLTIDLSDLSLKDVCLNSECFQFEESTIQYKINNNYISNKTEIYIFDKDKINKENTILPIIPINFNNLSETLQRIKTLLTFS